MAGNEVTLEKIYNLVNEFRAEVRDTYATKEELKPVRTIVYSAAALVLLSVFDAIVTNVVIPK